jgi:hypothetical protein
VVLVFLPLDPDARVGEEVNAVEMIPVHVGDNDVGDLFSANAKTLDGGGGTHIVDGPPSRDEFVPVEARIHQYDSATSAWGADQPHHERDVHAPRRVGAGNERSYPELRQRAVADGVHLVGCWTLRDGSRERPGAVPGDDQEQQQTRARDQSCRP